MTLEGGRHADSSAFIEGLGAFQPDHNGLTTC
jgi:hypothetical protein